MNNFIIALIFTLTLNSCHSQTEKTNSNLFVGGPCEGCEAALEYGNKILTPTDTLPGFESNSPKLQISGTVYEKDGKTPAKNVILYIYHTNRKGIYETTGKEKGWAKRHGFIRGWIKTDKTGKYAFYTFRPASYPGRKIPEHIHLTVKEPDKNPYYLDSFKFEDDPLLVSAEKRNLENRGGSGLSMPKLEGTIYLIKRDIFLGKNIPGYH